MDSNPEFQTQELPAPPAPELGPSQPVPSRENPPWGGMDLLIAACAFAAALFVVTTVVASIVSHTSGIPYEQLAKSPNAIIVVPAMIAAYLVLFATLYSRVATSQDQGFWKSIEWHWPSGNKWLVFVAVGCALAILLPLLSHVLPFPKSTPMDRFFRDSRAAYLMMFMGIAIAPFTEEILFRGFLYPVLDRWLKKSLGARQQLLKGCVWSVLMVGWGYVLHRISSINRVPSRGLPNVALVVAVVAFLPLILWSFVRWTRARPVSPILLPGIALCVWGVLSQSVSQRSFAVATAVLLAISVILGLMAMTGGLSADPASRIGTGLAILLTAGLFAMVHSDQLGGAWGPLLIILIVGLVLTITRLVTASVAPGFLIHFGYNFALFCTVYIGTDHFRHLERMNR